MPDVNQSFAEYAPSLKADATILFGLAAVRNVGEALVDKIVAEREANGPFESVFDFVRRVDPVVLNRRSMESLIKAGAFDSFGVARSGLLDEGRRDHRRDAQSSQGSLIRNHDAVRVLWRERQTATGRVPTIEVADMEFEQSVKLDFEREMLGTYISDHPFYEVGEASPRVLTEQ